MSNGQSEMKSWPIPAETASVLRDIDASCGVVLQRLGQLEVDYLQTKEALVGELKARRAQFKTLIEDAARKAGLDVDKARWTIDTATMTLNRAP